MLRKKFELFDFKKHTMLSINLMFEIAIEFSLEINQINDFKDALEFKFEAFENLQFSIIISYLLKSKSMEKKLPSNIDTDSVKLVPIILI